MFLHVIGSRSDGNAYVLQNGSEALLLEAGLPFKKTLEALDYNLDKVVGCLITHEHKDHAEKVSEYLKNGVRVYASKGTNEGMMERYVEGHHTPEDVPYTKTGAYKQFQLGGFTILPFKTMHSTKEPTGFLIHHPETGNFIFATDTGYISNRFSGLSNIMIEANYDPDILRERYFAGEVTQRRFEHVRSGHMSIETTIDTLRANDITAVMNIVLLHLSEEHADPETFRERVQSATGTRVWVAKPGLKIPFDKSPF